MALEFFFGVVILAIVAFVIFRIMGSIALGALLVLAVFLASYLLVGSFPELGKVPVLGQFIPKTTGEAIAIIKNVVYSTDILGVSKDSNNHLLVTIANTGRLEVSNFTAYVDGKQIAILNYKDSLKSGEVVVFELDWKDAFKTILVETDQTEAIYEFK